MSIQLTDQQNKVIQDIYNFHWKKPFFFGGLSGCGKTTVLKALAEEEEDNYLFIAPTNKAAQVLRSKLPRGAMVSTIHSVLYSPKTITDDYIKHLKQSIEQDDEFAEFARYKLAKIEEDGIKVEFLEKEVDLKGFIVVVDESSMVRAQEFNLLCQHAERIIFVGDPFQLLPVKSEMLFPTDPKNFDGFLTEVHRAALESPITRMAMEIRENTFSGWKYWSENGITVKTSVSVDTLRSADQIICGTNNSRHLINSKIRESIGNKTYHPVIGDKVIVKENVRYGKGELYACNGDIGYIEDIYFKGGFKQMLNIFYPTTNEHKYIAVHDELFAENYKDVDKIENKKIISSGKDRNYGVDYGYAITVHSSQGSEWDSVLFYDDGMLKHNPLERRRLMYTAITRAKKDLIIIKK